MIDLDEDCMCSGDDGFDPDGVVVGGEVLGRFDVWVGDAPDAGVGDGDVV